jgi:thioredoxin-like negative regulator of GroEL
MAKPSVDGLERRMGERLSVVRVDVNTDEGRTLAARYGVSALPTYVLVAPGGRVAYRQVGGRPDADEIERRVSAPAAGR